jgi:hypothetical protein
LKGKLVAKREELVKAARRRELDRWGRSLVDPVSILQELASLNIGFLSLAAGG